jgi:glycerol kinase
MKHIAVLDEGTTSTRGVLIGEDGSIVTEQQEKVSIFTPGAAKVEQDAKEIIELSIKVLKGVLDYATEKHLDVDCIAVTNQRTNTTIMDRATGDPVTPMIGWQDGRCQERVDQLGPEWGPKVFRTAGINLAAASVALHAEWFLNSDPELRRRAEAGDLILGVADTVVLKALTGEHLTSTSNASATGSNDFRAETKWWGEWLDFLGVPVSMYPEIRYDDAGFGVTKGDVLGYELPIVAVMADQQAALFGHAAFQPGAGKCTHGTGSFVDFNIGQRLLETSAGLDNRIAWRIGSGTANCIEGATWVSGSAIEWLIDDMKMLKAAKDVDAVCRSVTPSGLIVVPVLAGFASPYWDATARGTAFGLSRHTSDADFVEATVTGIAHTVVDLLTVIMDQTGTPAASLAVDGGLARSDYLQQMTADLLGVPVERTANAGYVTAVGTAWIAGLARGIYTSPEEAAASRSIEASFEPKMSDAERQSRRDAWKDAVQRSLGWHDPLQKP